MEWRVADAATTTLAARAEQLPALLDFARAFGRERDLPEPAIHRLIVILEELFLNTVHHGHGGGSDAPVTVELSLANGALQCSYTDGAPVFVPPVGLPSHIGRPAEARPVGSRRTGERLERLNLGHQAVDQAPHASLDAPHLLQSLLLAPPALRAHSSSRSLRIRASPSDSKRGGVTSSRIRSRITAV